TVLAVTDDDYMDWPILPEAPSSLAAVVSGGSVRLRWEAHGSDTRNVIIERRIGQTGQWTRIATQPVGTPEYVDTSTSVGGTDCATSQIGDAKSPCTSLTVKWMVGLFAIASQTVRAFAWATESPYSALYLRHRFHCGIAVTEEFRPGLHADTGQLGRCHVSVFRNRNVVNELWILVRVLPIVALHDEKVGERRGQVCGAGEQQ